SHIAKDAPRQIPSNLKTSPDPTTPSGVQNLAQRMEASAERQRATVFNQIEKTAGSNCRVAIGDTVRMKYLSDDRKTLQITISKTSAAPAEGIVNHKAVVAGEVGGRGGGGWGRLGEAWGGGTNHKGLCGGLALGRARPTPRGRGGRRPPLGFKTLKSR